MKGGGRDVTLQVFSMSVVVGCLAAKEVKMEEDRLRGAAQRLKGEGVRSNGGVWHARQDVDEKWEVKKQICCDVKRKTRIGRGNKMCDKLQGGHSGGRWALKLA
jgi:hypothetical protein